MRQFPPRYGLWTDSVAAIPSTAVDADLFSEGALRAQLG